jgi:ABC-type antimicrobial peptide transport system permease subunit
VIAVLVAVVGLYGVVAEFVARRTTEIGLRMALGARQVDILAMVVRQAGLLVGGGLVLGALTAMAAADSVRAFLFGVQAHDAATMAVACGALATAALGAALFPAWRAAMLKPLVALRE